MRTMNILISALICLTLCGCGWHLRTNELSGGTLDSVYIASELAAYERGPNSIIHGFDQRLLDLDITSRDSISDAQLGLIILAEEREERVLSLTSDLFEQQSRLSKTVVYQVWRGDELVVDNAEASTYRDITQDQSNAAAKNRETDLIYSEINVDLINQILRRLQWHAGNADANSG